VGRIAVACIGFPSVPDIFGTMAAALEAEMRRAGYDPVLIMGEDPAMRLARAAERWDAGEVDGYIHIGSLPEVVFPAMPGVVIGEIPDGAPVHQVVVDNVAGGRRVGEYLWSLGHRRVAFIALEELIPGRRRFQGMQEALRERGAAEEDARFVPIRWIGSGSTDLATMDSALEDQLSGPNPPTAIFFGNDHVALPGLQSLISMGYRVPQDISVVGFDDAPGLASHTRPPMTCMRMPALSLGALAVQFLHQSLQAPEAAFRRARIPAELIVRESTGAVSDAVNQQRKRQAN
jgi:LacI family transcriptional regulator